MSSISWERTVRSKNQVVMVDGKPVNVVLPGESMPFDDWPPPPLPMEMLPRPPKPPTRSCRMCGSPLLVASMKWCSKHCEQDESWFWRALMKPEDDR